jgi:hypothetical protein
MLQREREREREREMHTHVYRAGIGEALKGHANPKEGLLCWFIKLLI